MSDSGEPQERFAHYFDTLDESRIRPFTSRQREVVYLLSHGLATDMIAEVLGVSPHTVRTHVDNARGRVNAKTRAHLIAIAFRSNQLPGPDVEPRDGEDELMIQLREGLD